MGPLHDKIQHQINETLLSLGFKSKCERRGNGWRADVYAESTGAKYAFEVQTSPQTYNRTIERQSLYMRDGIVCCWLFEKEPAKQRNEREDLPVFRVYEDDGGLMVSLKGRKELPLDVFVADFVSGRIKFCKTLSPLPFVEVNFIEFQCYKCKTLNHIYFLSPFKTACNVELNREESLWTNDKFSLDKRIVQRVQAFVAEKPYINLATIKERHSYTVGNSYLSFGCSKCDALFGDFYVWDAVMESWYGDGVVERVRFPIDFNLGLKQELPHWCHPGDYDFCE